MRILYLTPELPFPLTSGFLRHYFLIRGLAHRGHTVSLVSLTSTREPQDAIAELRKWTAELFYFQSSGSVTAKLACRMIGPRAALRKLRTHIRAMVEHGGYDVAIVAGKTMASLPGFIGRIPTVVDCCDAAHVRLREEMRMASLPSRLFKTAQYLRLRRLETALVKTNPYVVFASERDRAAFPDRCGVLIPNGVDLRYWTRSSPLRPESCLVAFTGVMAYAPNHDAALVLGGEAMPKVQLLIPDAEAVIVGRDPRPRLIQAAMRWHRVQVTGAVPDIRPYLELAAVFAAPMRFASGIQNKVLEAMAMELPVVTTPVVAAGLKVNGANAPVIVAADMAEFAQAVVRLLRDPDERRRLGTAGRAFVQQHLTWPRSVQKLEQLCTLAAAGISAELAQLSLRQQCSA